MLDIKEALLRSKSLRNDAVFGPCSDLDTLIQIARIARDNDCHPVISSYYGKPGIVIAHTSLGVCDA